MDRETIFLVLGIASDGAAVLRSAMSSPFRYDEQSIRAIVLSLIMLTSVVAMGAGPVGASAGDEIESTDGLADIDNSWNVADNETDDAVSDGSSESEQDGTSDEDSDTESGDESDSDADEDDSEAGDDGADSENEAAGDGGSESSDEDDGTSDEETEQDEDTADEPDEETETDQGENTTENDDEDGLVTSDVSTQGEDGLEISPADIEIAPGGTYLLSVYVPDEGSHSDATLEIDIESGDAEFKSTSTLAGGFTDSDRIDETSDESNIKYETASIESSDTVFVEMDISDSLDDDIQVVAEYEISRTLLPDIEHSDESTYTVQSEPQSLDALAEQAENRAEMSQRYAEMYDRIEDQDDFDTILQRNLLRATVTVTAEIVRSKIPLPDELELAFDGVEAYETTAGDGGTADGIAGILAPIIEDLGSFREYYTERVFEQDDTGTSLEKLSQYQQEEADAWRDGDREAALSAIDKQRKAICWSDDSNYGSVGSDHRDRTEYPCVFRGANEQRVEAAGYETEELREFFISIRDYAVEDQDHIDEQLLPLAEQPDPTVETARSDSDIGSALGQLSVGETETIEITVSNNGGISDTGFLSISHAESLQVTDVVQSEGTPEDVEEYAVGDEIESESGSMSAEYPLIDIVSPYEQGDTNTYTITVERTSPEEAWVKYRAAHRPVLEMPSETENFERAPTSGPVDQQGWHAYRISAIDEPEPAEFVVDGLFPDSAVEGETLDVSTTVKNVGEEIDTQDVEFLVDGNVESVAEDVELDEGDEFSHTFEYETETGDAESVTVELRTQDDTESTTASVSEPEPDSAFFEISNIDADDPVTEEDLLTTEVTVTNTGEAADQQDVVLRVDGSEVDRTTTDELTGEEEWTETLTYSTEVGDAPSVDLEVATDDDATTDEVTIDQKPDPAFFDLSRDSVSGGPIEVGDQAYVDAEVENRGDLSDTQTIELHVSDRVVNTTEVTLEGGEATAVNLTYDLRDDDPPELEDVQLESDDSSTFSRTIYAYDEDELVQPDPEDILWTYENSTGVSENLGGILVNETIVVTDFDGNTDQQNRYAINAETGTERWVNTSDSWKEPQAGENFVIMGGDEEISAIEPATGQPVWTFETDSWVNVEEVDTTYDEIYAYSGETLYGLDAETGEPFMEVDDVTEREIIRAETGIYAIVDDQFVALTHDGEVRWEGSSLEENFRGLARTDDGSIAVAERFSLSVYDRDTVSDADEPFSVQEYELEQYSQLHDIAATNHGFVATASSGAGESAVVRVAGNSAEEIITVPGSFAQLYEGKTGLYVMSDQLVRLDHTGQIDWTADSGGDDWRTTENDGQLLTQDSTTRPVTSLIRYDAATGEANTLYEFVSWVGFPEFEDDTVYINNPNEKLFAFDIDDEFATPDVDFEVTDPEPTDQQVKIGQQFNASTTISNPSDDAAVRQAEFELTRENTTVYADSKPVSLDSGDSESVKVTIDTVRIPPGEYDITVRVGDETATNQTQIGTDEEREPGPVVQSATVRDDAPDEVVLVFDEEVNLASEADTSDASSLFTFETDLVLENQEVNVTEGQPSTVDGDIIVPLDSTISADDPDTITGALDYDATDGAIVSAVDGRPAGSFQEQDVTNNVEANRDPGDPAEPALSGLNIAGDGTEAAITEGDNESIDVDVENVGDEADRFRIDLSIDDEVTITEGIDVGPGETRTLTFDGVTDGLDVQDEAYTVTVQDNEEVADALIGDLTVEVEPEQADPALSNLEIAGDGDDATITERDDESISVDVENVGDEEGTFDIELEINGVEVSDEVTLDADATEEVEFTGVTDGLDARDDAYTVTVQDSDGDAEISGNLMVEQVDGEDPDVGIRHSESAAAATSTLVDGQLLGAERLVVESSVDDQLTIGGDTDRTIEIRHPETDRSLEVTTEGDEAVTGDGFRLFISDGDGTLSDQPTIASLEGDSVDVELEGDENIFTDIDGPFTTYTMALQEDGEEIDTTDKRLIGIGYEGAFEQTGTEDEVEITLPRDDEVDESWDIEFRLGATEDDGPLATTAVDNQDGDDLFETTVDVSDVEQGVYGAHLRMAQDTADPDASDRVLSVFEFESITVGDPEDIAPEIGLEADAGGSTDSPIPIDVSIEQREPETATLEIVDSEDNVVFSESVEEDFQDSQTVSRRLVWDATDQDGDPVDDGEYTAVFTVEDEFGNEVVAEKTIVVNSTPPEIDGLEIAGDGDDATITEGDGESIEVDVENVGDEADRFYLTLEINDEVESEEGIDVDAGDTETLTFDGVTDDLNAQNEAYTVSVQDSQEVGNELTGDLTVEAVDEEPEVGIKHAEASVGWTNTIDGEDFVISEVLNAVPDGQDTIEFGGDTDRTIEIRNTETDASVEIIPEADEGTYDVDLIRLDVHDGTGELTPEDADPDVRLAIPEEEDDGTINETNERLNVTLDGDEDVFTSSDGTFTEFELDLVEDGTVVDTSDERLIGVGYVGGIEQDSIEDEVTVTIPRDEGVDEDWFVEFRLTDLDLETMLIDTKLRTEVEHSDDDDVFEFTIDVSDVEDGEYTPRLDMYESEGAPFGERIVNVRDADGVFQVGDGEDEDVDVDIDLDVQPDLVSTQTPLEITTEISEENVESAQVSIVDADGDIAASADASDAIGEEIELFWPATDGENDPVADGEYSVEVTATTDDGEEVTAESDPFQVDNSPPEVEDIEVDTDLTNDEVTVSADVSGVNSDVTDVQLGLSATFTAFTVTEPAASGETEGELEATIDAAGLVADGDYSAIVIATDAVGNEQEVENDLVTIDTSAPEIQPRATDLGEGDATLEIEADEDITIGDIDIEAAAGENTEDRSPAAPSERTDEFEIKFDGTTVDGEDTTFTIDVVAEDEAGNEDTYELTSSITGYEIEDGEATVDPDATDGAFDLSADEDADGERSAAVGQTSSAPAGTSVDTDQLAEEFIDVADIGLDEDELEDATVRVPLEDIDVDDFDDEDLVFFYSPEGEEDYEVLEPEIADDELVVDVDGFSQLAPGGVDDQPPSLDETTIDPGTELDADDGDVTLTFDYSPVISDIDVSATRVDVDLDDDRTDVQITSDDTEVVVEDLQSDETFTVELTLVDEAGNDITTTETLSVGDAPEDESEDDEGASSGDGGSGGGGGAGAPVPDDEQFEISAPEVRGQEDGTTPIDVTATITNVGGPSEGQSVELEIDGETVAEKQLALGSNGQATVEFSDVDISEVNDGEYTYRITTDDDTYTDTLTIGTADSPDDADREVETADDASDDPTDAPTDTPEEESEDETPGFGAVVALIALIAAALFASRQQLLD